MNCGISVRDQGRDSGTKQQKNTSLQSLLATNKRTRLYKATQKQHKQNRHAGEGENKNRNATKTGTQKKH